VTAPTGLFEIQLLYWCYFLCVTGLFEIQSLAAEYQIINLLDSGSQ
jgi:hypothetical protein